MASCDQRNGEHAAMFLGVTIALPAVAAVGHRRPSWSMPTRRRAETTPDLFSLPPTVTAAGPSAVSKGKVGPDIRDCCKVGPGLEVDVDRL